MRIGQNITNKMSFGDWKNRKSGQWEQIGKNSYARTLTPEESTRIHNGESSRDVLGNPPVKPNDDWWSLSEEERALRRKAAWMETGRKLSGAQTPVSDFIHSLLG